MAAARSNIWNIKVGDVISFTNTTLNRKTEIEVLSVDRHRWFSKALGMSKWSTIELYSQWYSDFQIIRK